MRTSPWIILPLAAFLSACVWIESGSGGRMRSDCERHAPGTTTHHPPSGPEPKPAGPDTTVWLSAVRFPKDYDWQRDTAYVTASCELLL